MCGTGCKAMVLAASNNGPAWFRWCFGFKQLLWMLQIKATEYHVTNPCESQIRMFLLICPITLSTIERVRADSMWQAHEISLARVFSLNCLLCTTRLQIIPRKPPSSFVILCRVLVAICAAAESIGTVTSLSAHPAAVFPACPPYSAQHTHEHTNTNTQTEPNRMSAARAFSHVNTSKTSSSMSAPPAAVVARTQEWESKLKGKNVSSDEVPPRPTTSPPALHHS